MNANQKLQSLQRSSLKCLHVLIDHTYIRSGTVFSTAVAHALVILDDFPKKMAEKYEVPRDKLEDWADHKSLPVNSVRADIGKFIQELAAARLAELGDA